MPFCDASNPASVKPVRLTDGPSIVVGITHAQTCLVLVGRLRALREAGFRVILISSPGQLLDRIAAEEGVEQLAIPIERGIAPLADFVSLVRLWRALRRLKPDITEFSTPKAGLLGNLAAFLCGVPIRVYLLRGLRLETSTGLQRQILLLGERLAGLCAHHVVCNSRSLQGRALALRLAAGDKLRLLGEGSSNGVDIERFSPGQGKWREQLDLPRHAFVVGFVGRLTRDKGVPELIAAFDRLLKIQPGMRLLLVGWFDESEDALDGELRAYIDKHPRIKRTGYVADTAPCYRAMDLLVLPTWREGFPNVVLEAAATGVPVITTFSTGSRDAVLPEVTGLLIPAGYPEAISEAVLQLQRDPDRRRRMGRAARRWVSRTFGNERVLGLTIAMYKSLVAAAAEKHSAAVTKAAAAVQG